MTTPDPAAPKKTHKARYVLITECLQNDFFLNPDCRLYLSDAEVKKLLVAKDSHDDEVFESKGGHRRVKERYLKDGPLAVFLRATIGERLTTPRDDVLHVINVRDWHDRNESYDEERRVHGRHCESRTWGAGYIDGLQQYLHPGRDLPDGRAGFYAGESVRIYHVHADSIFDFRPRWTEHSSRHQPKFKQSRLEQLLDILIAGDDEQVEELMHTLNDPSTTERQASQAYAAIAHHAIGTPARELPSVYVAVIGIYTDVKVPILLAGLRARYLVPNLAVSDTLTASRALERHLFGLDFADKLLRVEVIHGIEDLAAYVGSELEIEDETKLVAAPDFRQFRSYFADKQNVLAHQSERLSEYELLTEKRSIRVYRMISYANAFLLLVGGAFLVFALVTSILNLIAPETWDWKIAAVTGGLGLGGLITVFFTRPIQDLQQNLNNLASFKMILEGHSLKEAFTRYHLTTPEVLREVGEGELQPALEQIEALRRQLEVIDSAQKSDYDALGRVIGMRLEMLDGHAPQSVDGKESAPSAPTAPAGA